MNNTKYDAETIQAHPTTFLKNDKNNGNFQ